MKFIIIISCVFVFSVSYFNKKRANTNLDSFIGTWKGTSLCQVKNSPCHDEIVVYHVTKTTADSCTIQANKIVHGVEEDMGILFCRYDKKNKELISEAPNTKWKFRMNEGKLEGTLIYRNSLYRKIELNRQTN